jgi:eukaryotic-like serine/threonine-protein kinase
VTGTPWERVEALFHAALERPVEEREAWVEARAAGDEKLLRRVKRLLEAHDAVERDSDLLPGVEAGIETGEAAALLRWAGEEPNPGDEIGRYRIVGVVGQGGMGTVYLAEDPVLGRSVALKFLPSLLQHEDRLLAEARAASALDHPCIGTVYEVGEDSSGRRFMAMAYYEGGTLRDRVRGGPLALDEAVTVAVQVADALDAAHTHGIVHRDVKPENLVFDGAGRVKVVDFGIARAGSEAGEAQSTGGTRAYMSPEQRSGGTVDGRTDLWSLGVVLHEMLTGGRPTEVGAGDEMPAGTIPGAVQAVLTKCLAPDPADRFQTGKALAEALRDATRPPPRLGVLFSGPRGRVLAGGLVAAAVVLVAGGGLLARQLPRVAEASGSASGVFEPRGTVVLADLEAPPELDGVALAIREAFAVDLQQSGFVSVLSRAAVDAVLERMQVAAGDPLRGGLAREVAERAGARAVLETSVARLGSRYALSTRGIDPRTGSELFAVRTTAGERRLLGAVERLSREARSRLGESSASLEESRPLPEVTTASLEALRYLAEAERYFVSDRERTVAALAAAVELDPGFAMAHRLAAAARTGQASFGDVAPHLELAYAHRDRLSDRERWHIEAFRASEVVFDPELAVSLYRRILMRFPDDVRAAGNLGLTYMSWYAQPERAWEAFEAGLAHHPDNPHLLGNALFLAVVLDRPADLETLSARARAPGADPSLALLLPHVELARAYTLRDTAAVRDQCGRLLPTPGFGPWNMADIREYCGSMEVSLGEPDRGIETMEPVFEPYLAMGRYRNATHVAHGLAAAEMMRGDAVAAEARLLEAVAALPVEGFAEPDRYITRTNLRIHAIWMGWDRVETAAREKFPPHADPEDLLARGGEALVRATSLLRDGDPAGALSALEGAFPGEILPLGWRFFVEHFRGMAHEGLGNAELARDHYRRAEHPRWGMFPIMTKDRVFAPLSAERLAGLVAPSADG